MPKKKKQKPDISMQFISFDLFIYDETKTDALPTTLTWKVTDKSFDKVYEDLCLLECAEDKVVQYFDRLKEIMDEKISDEDNKSRFSYEEFYLNILEGPSQTKFLVANKLLLEEIFNGKEINSIKNFPYDLSPDLNFVVFKKTEQQIQIGVEGNKIKITTKQQPTNVNDDDDAEYIETDSHDEEDKLFDLFATLESIDENKIKKRKINKPHNIVLSNKELQKSDWPNVFEVTLNTPAIFSDNKNTIWYKLDYSKNSKPCYILQTSNAARSKDIGKYIRKKINENGEKNNPSYFASEVKQSSPGFLIASGIVLTKIFSATPKSTDSYPHYNYDGAKVTYEESKVVSEIPTTTKPEPISATSFMNIRTPNINDEERKTLIEIMQKFEQNSQTTKAPVVKQQPTANSNVALPVNFFANSKGGQTSKPPTEKKELTYKK